MNAIANKQPRGWIVAARPKACRPARCLHCKTYRPAYDGAVFADKAMATRKADMLRACNRDFNVRVLRDGLVK